MHQSGSIKKGNFCHKIFRCVCNKIFECELLLNHTPYIVHMISHEPHQTYKYWSYWYLYKITVWGNQGLWGLPVFLSLTSPFVSCHRSVESAIIQSSPNKLFRIFKNYTKIDINKLTNKEYINRTQTKVEDFQFFENQWRLGRRMRKKGVRKEDGEKTYKLYEEKRGGNREQRTVSW